jgi:hypothetical protein
MLKNRVTQVMRDPVGVVSNVNFIAAGPSGHRR